MKVNFDKAFNLKGGEVKVFAVSLTSDFERDVIVDFEGVNAVCLYNYGKDYLAKDFVKYAHLEPGKEKRLWCYIEAPLNSSVDTLDGKITVSDKEGNVLYSDKITLSILEGALDERQFDEIESLRRLKWLNSDYQINDSVVKPFVPVKVDENTVKILGREVVINKFGLPGEINTYFSESVRLTDEKTSVLSSDITFNVLGQRFDADSLKITSTDEAASVMSHSVSEDFELSTSAKIEFDGYIKYSLTLTAKNDVSLDDISLVLPYTKENSKYFMGLGKRSGLFDYSLDFKWNDMHQDMFWAGNTNGGIRVRLMDDTYEKPLVNIYYPYKPMIIPESWNNGGKGGIRYDKDAFVCYSGHRDIKANDTLHFDFELFITPIKPIDLEANFNMRFHHRMFYPDRWLDASEKGANIVNIHHGNDLNPYINYPFAETEALSEYIKEAHRRGMKAKVYYTIRELSVFMPEFKALRDFDYELFVKADDEISKKHDLWQGESKQWIKENVGDDVIPAWRQLLKGDKYFGMYDASIITNGQSRLCNFYIEGLKALMDVTDIDGLYIDDVAFDRDTMKRVRRTLDRKEGTLIDFHTWNHNCARAAYSNSLNMYMELLPYINKLWVGEGFNYSLSPDYWLVEISGIPFGLMSELMIEERPRKPVEYMNKYRGLTFGMTERLGWDGGQPHVEPAQDPSGLWKIFDKYSLGKCDMYGYWDKRNTVKTGNDNVIATLFKGDDGDYIAFANWTESEQKAHIVDTKNPGARLYCPEIATFQSEGYIDNELVIKPGEGYFVKLV